MEKKKKKRKRRGAERRGEKRARAADFQGPATLAARARSIEKLLPFVFVSKRKCLYILIFLLKIGARPALFQFIAGSGDSFLFRFNVLSSLFLVFGFCRVNSCAHKIRRRRRFCGPCMVGMDSNHTTERFCNFL